MNIYVLILENNPINVQPVKRALQGSLDWIHILELTQIGNLINVSNVTTRSRMVATFVNT